MLIPHVLAMIIAPNVVVAREDTGTRDAAKPQQMKRAFHLTFGMLAHHALKNPLTCNPAGTASVHFCGYLNSQ